MQEKASIREQIIARRDAAPAEVRIAWSRSICQTIIALPQYISAKVIHCFLSIGSEVDTQFIVQHALLHGKRVAIPHFLRNRDETPSLEIHTLDSAAFAISGFGLRVPHVKTAIAPEAIDIVFVPLVAFTTKSILRCIEDTPKRSIIDTTYHRIGYGAGYYDRFLARLRPSVPCIGLAFELQRVVDFNIESHDVPLDLVISEQLRK